MSTKSLYVTSSTPSEMFTEHVVTPTYTCSTTGAHLINITANTVTNICALVPSSVVNVRQVSIEQILLSINGGNAAQSTPFEVMVGMCSSAGGSVNPILAHDRSDVPCTMSFINVMSSVVPQNLVPFSISLNESQTADGIVVALTRANFPGGKPITLRNGFAEGIYVFGYTDFALTGQPFVSCAITWTEE